MTGPVGVIGWYGQGNAGDDRILSCIHKGLHHPDLLVMSSLSEAEDRAAELNQCRAVIFGGGGLVLAGANRYASLIEALHPPLITLGISVEASGAATEELRTAIGAKSQMILVRDYASSFQFPGRNDVVVTPDVTFLDPLDVLNPYPIGPVTINIRPWPAYRKEPRDKLAALARRIVQRSCTISVRMGRCWRPEYLYRRLKAIKGDIRPLPLCINAAQDDRIELNRFHSSVPAAWSPDLLEGAGWVLGMRLHSLVFACQSGLPFVGLDYQPKVRQFVNGLGLTDMAVPIYGLNGLRHALDRLHGDYTNIRQHLLAYREQARDELERAFRMVRNAIR